MTAALQTAPVPKMHTPHERRQISRVNPSRSGRVWNAAEYEQTGEPI